MHVLHVHLSVVGQARPGLPPFPLPVLPELLALWAQPNPDQAGQARPAGLLLLLLLLLPVCSEPCQKMTIPLTAPPSGPASAHSRCSLKMIADQQPGAQIKLAALAWSQQPLSIICGAPFICCSQQVSRAGAAAPALPV